MRLGAAKAALLAGGLAFGLAGAAPLWGKSGTPMLMHANGAREAAMGAILAEAARDPGELRLLLRSFPKGGDLHNHLSGALYAEDMIGWAGRKGLCVAADGAGFASPPCAPGSDAASLGATQPALYARLVDSLSTRAWQSGVGAGATSGHDQFFATFDRFAPALVGEDAQAMIAARRQAARDGLLYLELDHNPPALLGAALSAPAQSLDMAGLPAFLAQEGPRLAALVPAMRAQIDAEEAEARAGMACGTPRAEPGCAVVVHYLAWALRDVPPAAVFRALILAFALAEQDPRFVGANIVQPEDWPVARADYDLHMAMFRLLEQRHPGVAVSMHAGELAFGQVPPADLGDHIEKAVASGARRIGHGVDIAFEDHGRQTLARMARDGVAVEINLTSNAVILGVKGADHPLALYRRYGVPVVLATDDQGVLRTDLTNEYVRAVREQGLGYADLKAITRASLEYSFLPGASLWRAHEPGQWAAPCANAALATAACQAFLAGSEKARLQIELERRLDRFEAEEIAQATQVSKKAA
ncbi:MULTISPECIES: adenosine deaminase [unclassified Novosphingobium]|uniref:adenosine deaminase family protein n=1 Tax=unclassified Novosphingobium TaxID=2644732 RepID=UPI00179D042C|nr:MULTISPECIES: adenosine deaminase [unclassified Novosphingobium]NMN04365.1 adenosine deaminase [Novosphingobium sp. SG919]NMN85644.1 adenosine deaminase [Novosphingobium sp. SG916]